MATLTWGGSQFWDGSQTWDGAGASGEFVLRSVELVIRTTSASRLVGELEILQEGFVLE